MTVDYPLPTVARDTLYMLPYERHAVLRSYAETFGLRYFVETGTAQGETALAMQPLFSVVHTIELDLAAYNAAYWRFKPYPNIVCWFGDSGQVLKDVLMLLDSPGLIWLDGHYSGPGSSHGVLDTPIVEELRTLFKDQHRHIILIDDARVFAEGPENHLEPHYGDYPPLSWVKSFAEENGYQFILADDIMRLTPLE